MSPPNRFHHPDPALLEDLRARIRRLERHAPERDDPPGALALGAPEIDGALPWGGLPRASLHEIIGGDGAASGFCAALLARLAGDRGSVLWCRRGRDLYGPGLAAFGLDPGRLIVVRGRTPTDVLWAMEEGLRSGGLAAVLGETDGIGPTAARRLQLAAEAGCVTALLLRPAHGKTASAVTRWRVSAAPGVPAKGHEGAHGSFTGAPWWRVELLRCRASGRAGNAVENPGHPGAPSGKRPLGAPRSWLVEWRDGTTGGFTVAAELRHRPVDPAAERVGARLAV
jgi:protein ImuA